MCPNEKKRSVRDLTYIREKNPQTRHVTPALVSLNFLYTTLHYSCGRLAHDSRTWSGRDAIQHFLSQPAVLLDASAVLYHGGSISVEWTGGSAARGSWRPGSQLQARSRRPCQRPQNPTPDPSPDPSPQPPHAAPEPNVRLYLTMHGYLRSTVTPHCPQQAKGQGKGLGEGSRGTGFPRQDGRPRARLAGGPLPRWP